MAGYKKFSWEDFSETDFSASCSEYGPCVNSEMESTEDCDGECEINEGRTVVGDEDNLCVVDNSKATKNQSEGNERKRKRGRNPEKWKKNIRKKNRTQGKVYTNTRGIVVPEKVFSCEQSCCSKHCFEQFNEDEQRKLFNNFLSLESFDEQNAFLFSQVKVTDVKRRYATTGTRKMNSRTYQLPLDGHDTKLCKKLFLKILSISNGRLDRVLKNKNFGIPTKDQRGRHVPSNKTPSRKVDEVCSFIDTFPQYESHYTRDTNCRKYLAPDINIKIMYNEYKKKHTAVVSEPVFRKIFCTKFNLHFHQPITDSCKRCDSLTVQIKHEVDDSKKSVMMSLLECHQQEAEKARNQMKIDAETQDSVTTVIAFDLMKTLPTPVVSTGITYYKRQLWTYCLGVHNLKSGTAVMYVWDESKASRGPEEIGSCLLHYFKKYVATENVIMYSDACGGQNRNIKMALFCQYVVQTEQFTIKRIRHHFLVSGHSYLPCDADFGVIEKQKRYNPNIFVPSDWIDVIRSSKKRKPFIVEEMASENLFSIKEFMKQCVTNRKLSMSNNKVQWMKVLRLNHNVDQPFVLQYSYDYNEELDKFESVYIGKRNKTSSVPDKLPILYKNGHEISLEKIKDLITLKDFIPPIFHNFYDSLKSSKRGSNTVDTFQDDSEGAE